MAVIKAAISGYGRIGRNILRAVYEAGYRDKIQIVAVNDLADIKTNAHLTRYDSVHGRFPADVGIDGDDMVINGDKIHAVSQRNPDLLPWRNYDVDLILECTGRFTDRASASAHIQAGAQKVLISAPAKGVDATIVYGINDNILRPEFTIVSNASCTTNAIAPLIKPLNDKIGVVSGLMTTVHAYTNDQKLIDVYHQDPRRARAAAHSIIPTKTGAANSLGLIIPELAGKLDGYSVRVPVINVSLIDLTFEAARDVTVEEINNIMKEAAQNELKGILDYSEEPLVSIDYNHTSPSCTFDPALTKVVGRTVKVLGWYDNEWAFSLRMLDTAIAMMNRK